MALEGLLQEFGLADILQLIYFQKKTGVLNIEGRLDNIELSFINGNISGLKSQRRLESNRLGRILIKKGLITQEIFDSAIEAQKTEGTKIGNYFVKHRMVSKEDLTAIIQDQIIETIVQIFTWKEGRYEFIPQGIPLDKVLPIYLDTQHLLMDGLRIVDEWSLVEGKLDLNTVYKKIDEPLSDEISDVEREVLGLVDGDKDVMTMINVSDSGDFETAKAIVSLHEKGIIDPLVVGPLTQVVSGAGKKPGYSFYIAVCTVILIVLLPSFKGYFDTYKSVKGTKTSFHIDKLKNAIDVFYAKNNRFPRNLEMISVRNRDPWNRPYVFKTGEDGFLLFSSGPDGLEGTEDDVY
jgi:hypothetical protein